MNINTKIYPTGKFFSTKNVTFTYHSLRLFIMHFSVNYVNLLARYFLHLKHRKNGMNMLTDRMHRKAIFSCFTLKSCYYPFNRQHSTLCSSNSISNREVTEMIQHDLVLKENFITEDEETSLCEELEPYLKRMQYEYDHWDNVIHGFRETERKQWTKANKHIIQRVRDCAFPFSDEQLPYVHVLDLEKNGYIKPHVDSVRFCGNTIAGICLLSSAVMRLARTDNKDIFVDALIKKRSLYIIRNTARYDYTHEILADNQSYFKGEHIPRDRRISVICRNEATDS